MSIPLPNRAAVSSLFKCMSVYANFMFSYRFMEIVRGQSIDYSWWNSFGSTGDTMTAKSFISNLGRVGTLEWYAYCHSFVSSPDNQSRYLGHCHHVLLPGKGSTISAGRNLCFCISSNQGLDRDLLSQPFRRSAPLHDTLGRNDDPSESHGTAIRRLE